MKLLDRYILKKFLSAFLFVVLVLIAIIVVIDFTEKNDDFIKRSAGPKSIIFDYYLNFIPYYANLRIHITVFIATVFVTAQLSSRTEIIAILSSGVSFRRERVPYLSGCSIIVGLIFCLNGWVIPDANKVRIEFEKKYLKDQFYNVDRNIHRKVAPQLYAYMESYDNTRDVGYRFTLEWIEGTNLKQKLEAERVVWQPGVGKWRLESFKNRTFEGDKETFAAGN